ncbi:MAG: hemin uptake protein HemP [Betaproteobacteria bacterium]
MHDESTSKPVPPPLAGLGTNSPPTRRVRSEELFRGAREIVIEHDQRKYQLRITQNGKLILTA